MTPRPAFFSEDTDWNLEESIRVDRQPSNEERLKLLQDYHITKDAHDFLETFFRRVLADGGVGRRGWNHWLYGYYGSGKSHLLAVLAQLLDSKWVQATGLDEVWTALARGNDALDDLEASWRDIHANLWLLPLPLNLLKYQGVREKSFTELILGSMHEQQGFSNKLHVAYFERWYTARVGADELESRAAAALDDAGIDTAGEPAWATVRKHAILSKLIIPKLVEAETGSGVGVADLVPSEVNPQLAAQELKDWAAQQGQDQGKPAKVILLLDEISLFIGTDYTRLTELNSLAERIDEIGSGDVLTVVTAQERIEEVQPESAPKSADFHILKDRFPHVHALPSRHVGEIVHRRLLRKAPKEHERLTTVLLEENDLNPTDAAVYTNIIQNTSPPLDFIDDEAAVDYYPLLPYQPALFMEILAQLRKHDVDRAKSVFSGTARAILALVTGLLQRWPGDDGHPEATLINLVEFYEAIEPELREIDPQRVEAIKAIDDEVDAGALDRIDARVARVVLLLEKVHEIIPLDEPTNIAVGVIEDLNGPTLVALSARVEESLGRLHKYIRPGTGDGAKLRFTTPEERILLDLAAEIEADAKWEDLLDLVQERIWPTIVERAGFPYQGPYPGDPNEYPLQYTFRIDDHDLARPYGSDDGLQVEVIVHGLLHADPGGAAPGPHVTVLIPDQGRDRAMANLRRWASLAQACADRTTSAQAIQHDLNELEEAALRSVLDVVSAAEVRVEGEGFRSLDKAVLRHLERAYPAEFHPLMNAIDQAHLDDLTRWTTGTALPDWAQTIQVPTSDHATHGGDIQAYIRGITGRALREHGPLTLRRVIDLLIEGTPAYAGSSGALRAVLWGLCVKGDFQAVTADSEPRPPADILGSGGSADLSLRLAPRGQGLREALERYPSVNEQHTIHEAIMKARGDLKTLATQIGALAQAVDVRRRSAGAPIADLLAAFRDALDERAEQATKTREEVDQDPSDVQRWTAGAEQAQWSEDTSSTWETRDGVLHQLDALGTLAQHDPRWLSTEAKEALNEVLEHAGNAAEIPWWTSDGWSQFADHIRGRADAIGAVRDNWQRHKDDLELDDLHAKLADHAWLGSPFELPPARVLRGFQRTFLDPLRALGQELDQALTTMPVLLAEDPSPDVDALRKAVAAVKRGDCDADWSTESVQEARQRLQTLDRFVGTRTPQQVPAIGSWPADRDQLQQRLRESEEDLAFEVDEQDGGVVIR